MMFRKLIALMAVVPCGEEELMYDDAAPAEELIFVCTMQHSATATKVGDEWMIALTMSSTARPQRYGDGWMMYQE